MVKLPGIARPGGEWLHIILAIGLILLAGVVEARGPGNAPPQAAKAAAAGAEADSGAPADEQSAALPATPPESTVARRTEELTVQRGDTLMTMLVKASVPRSDAHEAIVALRDVYDPRKLRPGQMLQVTIEDDAAAGGESDVAVGSRLAELMLEPDFRRNVVVRRQPGGGFTADEVEKTINTRTVVSEGSIRTSLFVDTSDQGVPIPIILKLIRTYSFDVDFQRDLQPEDRFRVMYEELVDENGRHVGAGELLHAVLTLSGKDYAVYRHLTADGTVDYYDADGKSVRKTLLRTPIDGARMSSGYGKRRHPVLGYTRMHRGVDFAAPSGTPIYAAGSGVVDYAGRKGGYGIYVRVRHNSEYQTAYAHMRNLAKGIHRGKRVDQGDVIGYVGTTGVSTGPHLHYEILLRGAQVNPQKVRFPAGRILEGTELAEFKKAASDVDARYAALAGPTRQASAEHCPAAKPIC